MIYVNDQPISMIPKAMATTHSLGLNLPAEQPQEYPPANNYTNIRDALLRLGIKATYRAIQSDNFVEDTSGWKLSAEGVGYFAEGNIGGWNINATTIYSDGNNIILDSANKKITVGASNPITIDGVNKRIQSDNYVSGAFGSGFHLSPDLLEVGNIACRGLIRTAVFQKDVVNVMGGNFAVLDGDVLDADMTALDASTLTTKATTTFSAGDILRIKDGTDDEWLEVITNVIDSYSESNASVEQPIHSITKIGQSFTGNGSILNTCKFYLKKVGSPTGNAVAKVYVHDGGTYGTNGKPTGTVLATSDNFDVSILTTSNQLIEFTFTGDEKITLTNGTYYFIVLEYNDGTPANHIKISYDGSSPTHSGNMVTGTWTSWAGSDLCFYVYTENYLVNRDKAANYAANTNPTWKKGATVVNYGQSGDGGVYMTASESNAPYLSVFTHGAEPWKSYDPATAPNGLATRLRIGNLNGYLGYTTDKYGIGIGDATHYLKYDPTNHLRIRGNIDASTITGTTITGGTIRTSSGNQKVQMSGANNRMEIYDSNGTLLGYFGNAGANGSFIYVNQPATDAGYPPIYVTSARDGNIFNIFNTHSTTAYPAFRIEGNSTNSHVLYVKGTGLHNAAAIENTGGSNALFLIANNNSYGTLALHQGGTGAFIYNSSNNAQLTKAGVWTDASSKTLKENFKNITVLNILKNLDIKRYNYIAEKRQSKTDVKNWLIDKNKREKYSQTDEGRKCEVDDKRYLEQKISSKEDVEIEKELIKEYAQELKRPVPKHISPMAEDFYKAFGVGDDKGISPKDLAGVALQAIKELTEKVEILENKLKQ